MTRKPVIPSIFTTVCTCLVALLLLSSSVYAAPPFQSPPDESWWESFIPEEYRPSQIGRTVAETVWGLMTEGLADWLKGWFDDAIAQFQGWIAGNWDLKNSGGLLGGALDTMFDSAALLVIPWISLSIIVTFFQRMLVAVFPGVVRNFGIGQHFGRLLIIIFFMNEYMLHALIDVTGMTSSMAFSMALGAGGGLVEWEWISTILSMVAMGALSFTEIILVVLIMTVLFFGIIFALLIKHLITFFLLAALPIVAAGWLYPFTEKLWGKFWWMYIKLLAAPFILAFALRIIIAILGMMGGNILVGLVIVLLVWAAFAWLLLKFLLMPETLMIAAGAGLTAAGAGVVGGPMITGGVGGYARRVTGSSSAGRAIARASQQQADVDRG